MHLPGDADRIDLGVRLLREDGADGGAARLPPRLGILLRPAGCRSLERERRGAGRGNLAARIDEDGLYTARADVEAEKQSQRTPSSSSIVS
jgi:hypothetical protein